MRKKIIVLGAGLVGHVMAKDLAKDFEVTAADINEDALKALEAHGIKTLKADLSDRDRLIALLQPFDLVVGSVPGFMGLKNAQTVIEAGKNMVDISFFPEDPFLLDEAAKKKNVTIITDCGVAPGMGNIILGFHNKRMNALWADFQQCVSGLTNTRLSSLRSM